MHKRSVNGYGRTKKEQKNELTVKAFGKAVMNVSKTGIGFSCDELLDMGAVYEAYLTIWTKEVIHAFIEIVRIEKNMDTYEYGGLFIGMPEVDLQRIEVYNTVADAEKNMQK